jgi:flagellar export protein FliJ
VKAYRFRLQSVARVREIQERIARERLMVSIRDLKRARTRENEAEDELASFEPPAGVVSMGDLLWAGDQADRLAESVRSARDSRVAAGVRCDESRAQWNVSVKRLDVLQRLEQQTFETWCDEVAREAGAELDDWANARHRPIGADA